MFEVEARVLESGRKLYNGLTQFMNLFLGRDLNRELDMIRQLYHHPWEGGIVSTDHDMDLAGLVGKVNSERIQHYTL